MMKRLVLATLAASLLACGGPGASDAGTGGGSGGGGGSVGGGGGSTGGGSGGGSVGGGGGSTGGGGGSVGGGGGTTGGGGGTTGGGGGTTGGGGGTTGGGGGSTDTTPPQVISTNPTTGSMNVPVGTVLQVLFSEAMATGTVTVTTSPSVTLGSPTWNTENTLVTLTPSAPLALNTTYTVTVNGLDTGANALTAVTFTFTTVASTDTTAPTVDSTTPANASTGVPSSSPITITFSESMNTSSVMITASPAVNFGTATWANNNTEATVSPSAPLTASTTYTISVTGRDVAGNNMASTFTFTFTTAAPPDTTPPSINVSTPTNGATNVTTTTRLSITFNEAMDTNTVVVTTTPAIDQGTGTWSNGDKTVTYSAPTADWSGSTAYTVNVAGADLAGNALSGASITFTTAAPPDTTPPTVQSTTPTSAATGVPQTANIQFVFSEPMNTTATQGAFSASPAISNCAFTWLAGDALLECNPGTDLTASTTYTVTLGTTAADKNGNTLAAPYVFTFTTAAAPDTTRPTIVSVTPANNSVGAPINTNIVVTFSEPMDIASAQTAFQMTMPAAYSGLFSWGSNNTVMTFNPVNDFVYAPSTAMNVAFSISTAAKDLAGNTLAAAANYSFRTKRIRTTNHFSCGLLNTCTASVPSGYMTGTTTCSSATATPSTAAIFGDNAGNLQYKGFLNFDLTAIGTVTNPIITDAVLNAYQYSCTGNPYSSTMGPYVRAFHIDYGTTMGVTDCDLDTTPLTGTTTFLSQSTAAGWKTASVLTAVRDDWTNRVARGSRSQYMIRMWSDSVTTGGVAQECRFATHTYATTTLRPYIAITYEYD